MLDGALAAGRNAAAGLRALTGGETGEAAAVGEATDFVAAGEPQPASPEAFYRESLKELSAFGVPFLLAGTYAFCAYSGISRPTKDLDVFCNAGDFPRILGRFRDKGFAIEVEDERWIGKVHHGDQFFDVIFASSNATVMHLLNFRWIYPSERDHVPSWLIDQLRERMDHQLSMPPPQVKACRGRMFSRVDYAVDVQQWGFADVAATATCGAPDEGRGPRRPPRQGGAAGAVPRAVRRDLARRRRDGALRRPHRPRQARRGAHPGRGPEGLRAARGGRSRQSRFRGRPGRRGLPDPA